MTLPDFLSQDQYGDIRLTGHRIGLYHVLDRYQEGDSPEMLHEEYPTLPLALIHKVLAFYLENQVAVDADVLAYRADLERQEAAHVSIPALLRIRQRLETEPHAPPPTRPSIRSGSIGACRRLTASLGVPYTRGGTVVGSFTKTSHPCCP